MMELQLIIFPAAIAGLSLWIIAWHNKLRMEQKLLAPGIVPIQRRKTADSPIIELFLPRSNIEFVAGPHDLLVIQEDGIKQVNPYELHLLRERPGHPHLLIEAFSLAD